MICWLVESINEKILKLTASLPLNKLLVGRRSGFLFGQKAYFKAKGLSFRQKAVLGRVFLASGDLLVSRNHRNPINQKSIACEKLELSW